MSSRLVSLRVAFVLCGLLSLPCGASARAADAPALQEPKPLAPGAKVVTLWPAGSPALKALEGSDKPEEFRMSKGEPPRVQSVVNVHNPSIELYLAPPEKANGMAVVLAP